VKQFEEIFKMLCRKCIFSSRKVSNFGRKCSPSAGTLQFSGKADIVYLIGANLPQGSGIASLFREQLAASLEEGDACNASRQIGLRMIGINQFFYSGRHCGLWILVRRAGRCFAFFTAREEVLTGDLLREGGWTF
jgi:hypothetical protein